ncbi:MAG: Gfo/Idh/MocA family oxidoreductase [Armatimonadetes bacterium]|nr:Gfo/Idh/MocA family oxidoreductase [Armatimonadota bacterium]
MKALFIGLGSIGQRHLRNFKELAGDKFKVIAYRTTNLNYIIKDGKVTPCDSLSDYYGFTEYMSFEDALDQKPDIGFICNPSKLHLETALRIAECGTHIFIEKPMATDTKLLNKLENIIRQKRLITMIGYQSRFHPCVQEVKRIIAKKEFGKVISADFNWATYLPDHHSYEDYRKGYAARKDLGGGVTFCLSHELDLIQYLLGLPVTVYAIKGATSRLEVDVEDTISALFKSNDKKRIFPVSLNLSFTQGVEQRHFSILMEDALLECDLQNNWLRTTNHKSKKIYKKEYKNLKRNDLFLEEMKHFIYSVIKKQETDIPLDEGKKSLFMALAIHKSLENRSIAEILL